MATSTDFREFVTVLDKLGDLRTVDREVDPHLEVGAIIRRAYETISPAPLFTNIAGTQPGFRLLGAPGALSAAAGMPLARLALAFDLAPEASARELVDHLAAARTRPGIPPVVVDSGPCKDNILLGDDATLDRFPTPLLHEGDGGPYVNTWGTIIARTPDGSFTNWSIARIMMIDGKHMTGIVVHPQHIAWVWQQWADLGKPMPYALVQGGPPALPYVAGMPLPDGISEAEYLGALIGEPVELVQCETVDLQVPASAEIVIEGHLSPERTADEGPMGEYSGYRPNGTHKQPIYTIDAITYRNEPIWPTVVEGEPVDEFHTGTGFPLAAEALAALRQAELPVTMAWAPFEMATHLLVVSVAADWRTKLPASTTIELAQRITDVIAAQRFDFFVPRILVLDDDVDPANPSELAWAMATRIHPTRRRIVRTGTVVNLLTCYTPEERKAQVAEKVTYDALLPAADAGRETRSSFRFIFPADVQQRVLDRWSD